MPRTPVPVISTTVLLPARVTVLPLTVRVSARVTSLPMAVRAVVPPGERTILPVPAPPKVRDWLLVVARLPLPVRKVLAPATLPAILAVGVPELTLMKANLAEEVA